MLGEYSTGRMDAPVRIESGDWRLEIGDWRLEIGDLKSGT